MAKSRTIGLDVCLGVFFVSLVLGACEPKDQEESLWTEEGSAESVEEVSEAQENAPREAPKEAAKLSLRTYDEPAPRPVLGPPEGGFASLVKQASPAVVNIYTTKVGATQSGRQRQGLYNDFDRFGVPRDRALQSLGTGFVISIEGHILTNHHVIDGASRIKVRFFDEREAQAEVVGVDPNTDIALLKVPTIPGMTPLALGDTEALEVGDWVLAIGNPLGLTHTVTAGIVSARGRTDIPLNGKISYMDFIQTDASINPGNSGGPLLNTRGEAIGINTAIAQGQGIGFAIPINMVKDILPQLMGAGRVQRSMVGLRTTVLSPARAKELGLDDVQGAWVDRVIPGGPAHQAGVEAGDLVVSFDGQAIDSPKTLRWLTQTAGVGRSVQLEVLRGKERLTLSLITVEMPE